METVQQLIVCGGCNAKIGPGNLGELLADLPKATNENLLVGLIPQMMLLLLNCVMI